MTADDLFTLLYYTLTIVGGLFVILSRRFWADRAARSIWRYNPQVAEKVFLLIGIGSVLSGLFILVGSIVFPVEPPPKVAQAEEPSCFGQLFGAIFGLGFGLYSAINHRHIAERGQWYIRNTDLLAKMYLVVGIVFILGGVLFATGVYEFCLGR